MWTKYCPETGILHNQQSASLYCSSCGAKNPTYLVQPFVENSGVSSVPKSSTQISPIVIDDADPNDRLSSCFAFHQDRTAESLRQKGFMGTCPLAKAKSLALIGGPNSCPSVSSGLDSSLNKYRTVVHLLRGLYKEKPIEGNELVEKIYTRWSKISMAMVFQLSIDRTIGY